MKQLVCPIKWFAFLYFFPHIILNKLKNFLSEVGKSDKKVKRFCF